MTPAKARSYVAEVLNVLSWEFSAAEQGESERKIRRRLREKKLGSYNQGRIDSLRAFKDDAQKELQKGLIKGSRFQTGPRGQYAHPNDWDLERLAKHLKKRHPGIAKKEIKDFLPWGVYLYYLR